MRTIKQKSLEGEETVVNVLYGEELIKTDNKGEIVICKRT